MRGMKTTNHVQIRNASMGGLPFALFAKGGLSVLN
jgi:hypothetical protein